ncbi:MAG: 4Fe-4S dicluster domain-containing protein [Deltaproteobacteria bacterium]|nr:4Fe-4S dicluster domain-containing protein [Deltaproteobacteria bacterium]
MLSALAGSLLVIECTNEGSGEIPEDPAGKRNAGKRWGYVFDVDKCIGCCLCMHACKTENDVPESVYRTWIERYRINADHTVTVETPSKKDFRFAALPGDVIKAFFVAKLCNHCDNTPCTQVCPVGASYQTHDGVVLIDEQHCVGCGYCVQACPYGTRFLHPVTKVASKCTLCYHRISAGKRPACVTVCPTGARNFGDLNDPKSEVSRLIKRHRYRVLKPELGTVPRCAYLGLDTEVV